MTKEQEEMAITMLESGCSYAQIGRNLGFSGTHIRKRFSGKYGKVAASMRREKMIRNCFFPNIRRWLLDNKISVNAFADMCYVNRSTIQNMLSKGFVSSGTVEQVLRVTGMPFEEAFWHK